MVRASAFLSYGATHRLLVPAYKPSDEGFFSNLADEKDFPDAVGLGYHIYDIANMYTAQDLDPHTYGGNVLIVKYTCPQ